MKLIVHKDSVLKPEPEDSSKLVHAQCHSVPAGSIFPLTDYGNAPNGHVMIELQTPVKGRKRWYKWPEHATVEVDEGAKGPNSEAEQTGAFRLPGYDSTFYLSNPVLADGNFTWNEVTKSGQRMPRSKAVVIEVMRIAGSMQDIRKIFGDRPIIVTSWYRDPVTNRRVGGASRSRHLTGGAVDFKVKGVSAAEVQRRLDPWWGSRGGLASASSFTHIDNRGYRARWRYGR